MAIEVSGMDSFLGRLEEMSLKMSNKITKDALQKAAKIERDAMEDEAPKRTHDMANSIIVTSVKTKNGVKYVEIRPNKKYRYYVYSELGRNGQLANPFMARSFARNKKRIKDTLKDEIRKGLGL